MRRSFISKYEFKRKTNCLIVSDQKEFDFWLLMHSNIYKLCEIFTGQFRVNNSEENVISRVLITGKFLNDEHFFKRKIIRKER
jgi:hypothetical protein